MNLIQLLKSFIRVRNVTLLDPVSSIFAMLSTRAFADLVRSSAGSGTGRRWKKLKSMIPLRFAIFGFSLSFRDSLLSPLLARGGLVVPISPIRIAERSL